MSSKKEYYYSIPGLLIPEPAPDNFEETMAHFVQTIYELTEELKESAISYDADNCTANLRHLLTISKKLYAKKIEADIEAALRFVLVEFEDVAKTLVPKIVSDLATLSIDIQSAQSNAELERAYTENMISLYSSAIQQLTAVQALSLNHENERALRLLHQIDLIKNFENHKELRKALLHKKFDTAKDILESITNKVYQMLLNLGGDINNYGVQKKILTVDDRPDVVATVIGVLRDVYQVYGATSGQNALAIIEKQKPDLFLLDIEMPGMDGYELIRRIKLKPEFKDTPFIFLTGNSDKAYVLKAMRSGANDFIVKPINHSLLITKVIKALYNVNIT